jgi:hypothetical protein
MRLEDYKFVSWRVNDNAPTKPVRLVPKVVDDIELAVKPASINTLTIRTGFSSRLYDEKVFDFTSRAYFFSFFIFQ